VPILTLKRRYLEGLRPWPLLTPALKRAIIRILVKGVPHQLPDEVRPSRGHRELVVNSEIAALAKSGCLAIIPSRSGGGLCVKITPSGFVQALCGGNQVWNESNKVFAHLREEMPNLAGCWSPISHASRNVALRLLASAVSLTVNGEEWFTGNAWEALERNYVLALSRSLEITEDERERIFMAARDDVRTREYFTRVIRQLFDRKEITTPERRRMMLAIRTPRN